jgi:hypothetical protein
LHYCAVFIFNCNNPTQPQPSRLSHSSLKTKNHLSRTEPLWPHQHGGAITIYAQPHNVKGFIRLNMGRRGPPCANGITQHPKLRKVRFVQKILVSKQQRSWDFIKAATITKGYDSPIHKMTGYKTALDRFSAEVLGIRNISQQCLCAYWLRCKH